MWDFSDLPVIEGISTLEHASHYGPFEHGLGRDPKRLALLNAQSSIGGLPRRPVFGITHIQPVALDTDHAETAIHSALELLQRHVNSWQDRISYQELGGLWQHTPDADTDENESSSETGAAKSVDKRFVMHPAHYGYLRLHSVICRAFKKIVGEQADSETVIAAELAERALKEILPEQAYLFISPDALMIASKEAERIAEETIKHAKQRDKEPTKESKVYGKIKTRLEQNIRGLRGRHDARMHIFPFTELSAPDTGVATIAIIASQQQSIINDHGRYSATARGLVF